MTDKGDYEVGYINGFYSMLQSAIFLTNMEGMNLRDFREGLVDVLSDMGKDGDLEYIKDGVDDFFKAAQIAEDSGRREEFLDFLETHTPKNEDNK